ncbi:MAG: DUF6265 family protein [Allosphingosinicella sp.]
MRRFATLMAGLLLAAAAPADVAIDDLAWISGSWESRSGEDWVEEVWSQPRGGTIFGLSRTGRGAVLREFEFLRVERGEDGRLVLLASPGGRPAVPFTLVEAGASKATFENAAHDYPQRISYEREDARLRATISKADGSDPASWSYRRLP